MGRFRAPAVGMDIDQGSIKAIQIAKSGGEYTLQHVGYRRLPPGTIDEGEVADHDLLVSEIQEFWSTHSFKGKSVVIGVANQKVVVRLLDFPHMEPDDLESAITFEAQDHIPMPMDDTVLDHVVLGPQQEGSDLDRILLVAAQKDMISRYTSAVRAAGLRPVGVDVKALALLRSTLPDSLFQDEGATLLLDIGSEITNLVVAQAGTPTLARFTPGGANLFVRAIAEATDLPDQEAARYLMNPAVSIGGGPDQNGVEHDGGEDPDTEAPDGGGLDPALSYDIRLGVEDAVQLLVEDVQRSIEYHYSQPGAQEVAQVYVSGEGALVSGLDQYVGELLGIAAYPGAPTEKTAANRSNVPDEQLRVMGPVLAIAVGLALEEA